MVADPCVTTYVYVEMGRCQPLTFNKQQTCGWIDPKILWTCTCATEFLVGTFEIFKITLDLVCR